MPVTKILLQWANMLCLSIMLQTSYTAMHCQCRETKFELLSHLLFGASWFSLQGSVVLAIPSLGTIPERVAFCSREPSTLECCVHTDLSKVCIVKAALREV